jgi:hypothetical protein
MGNVLPFSELSTNIRQLMMLLLMMMAMMMRKAQPKDEKVESILNNHPKQSYLITSLSSPIVRNYFGRPSGCNKPSFILRTGPY